MATNTALLLMKNLKADFSPAVTVELPDVKSFSKAERGGERAMQSDINDNQNMFAGKCIDTACLLF